MTSRNSLTCPSQEPFYRQGLSRHLQVTESSAPSLNLNPLTTQNTVINQLNYTLTSSQRSLNIPDHELMFIFL